MSLDIALSTAVSSLLVVQKQMSVASSNVSNADVAGYTRKTVEVASRVSAGQGSGVTIAGISSTVDRNLLRSIIDAASAAGYADAANTAYTSLDQALGQLSSTDGGGTDLASLIGNLESALGTLSGTPDSASAKSAVVSDLDEVTSGLRDLARTIQQQRGEADSSIASAVDDVNTSLGKIDDLNRQIRTAKASGQSTADLEDQRMQALQSLAGTIDVRYFTADNGDMRIYTGSGQALLDSSVHKLSYTAASSVSTQTTFNPITVNGKDITSDIRSGKLNGLIEQRDSVLPTVQAELDTLASTLSTSVNAVYNKATSNPPPASLTGTTSVAASDAITATGTVRVAVVDSSGKVSSVQDLDLSTCSTVADVVNALNGVSGIAASLDAQGHLVVKATASGSGVAINEMTSAVGSGNQGFSAYFGLNDLVTGSTALTIAVRSDIVASPSSLATGSLDGSSSLAAGGAALSSGSATIASALADAFSGDTSFAAAGRLGATKTSFADYVGAIVSDVSAAATKASSTATSKDTALKSLVSSFSSQSGVNIDQEEATLVDLQNAYAAAAKVVSTVQAMFQSLLDAVHS